VIYPELLKGQRVELDFDGVNICSASFFSAAIGRLVDNMDRHLLNRFLVFKNLSPVARETLRAVVNNAKKQSERRTL
jgi:predicted nucleic acid-binding OB-fold protein